MPAAVPRYLSAASTNQGLVRPNNEDRVYCDDRRGVFLVVDGMGGHEGGEEAAEIAIERIRARLERLTDRVEQRLREAITLANNAIFEAAQEHPAWKGMACVLTAAVIENGQVTVGHVGDSRLYRIRRGTIEKLTHDHSPVGEREDRGELTEIAAMQHPRRNEVYRDVGSEEHAPDDEDFIEVFQFPFEADSALLLCSDGLTDALPSRQILDTVERTAGNRAATVEALITAATAVGRDNVSVVWVEGELFAAQLRQQSEASYLEATAQEANHQPTALAALDGGRKNWYSSRPAYAIYGALLGMVLLIAAGAILLRTGLIGTGRTLTVAAGGKIADILQRAKAGDTVSVAPGNYQETVTLKEDVSLVSVRAGEAVIQGAKALGLRSARLEGFRIRGGEISVRVKDSDVILARDDVAEAEGAGVEFSGSSRGAIFGCTLHNNGGPGIAVLDTASPSIENNVISDNGKQQNSLRPGLALQSSARVFVVGNVFSGNGAEAIWLRTPDEAILDGNSFSLASSSPSGAGAPPRFRILPAAEGHP